MDDNAVVQECELATRRRELPMILQERVGVGSCGLCGAEVMFDAASTEVMRKACRIANRQFLLSCPKCMKTLQPKMWLIHEYDQELTDEANRRALEEGN